MWICIILSFKKQACHPGHPAPLLPLPHFLGVHHLQQNSKLQYVIQDVQDFGAQHLQDVPVGQSTPPEFRYCCLKME